MVDEIFFRDIEKYAYICRLNSGIHVADKNAACA